MYIHEQRTAQNFGSRKRWQIWQFMTNPQKNYPPKTFTLADLQSSQSTNMFSTVDIVVMAWTWENISKDTDLIHVGKQLVISS